MQPQGQFQIIRNLFDRGMSVGDAMNSPASAMSKERRCRSNPGSAGESSMGSKNVVTMYLCCLDSKPAGVR